MTQAGATIDIFEPEAPQAFSRHGHGDRAKSETTQRLPVLTLEIMDETEGCDPYNHVGSRLAST